MSSVGCSCGLQRVALGQQPPGHVAVGARDIGVVVAGELAAYDLHDVIHGW
jgi:hypothetical protein